ncbi:RDD family protein [Paenibacillus polymyxa]|uniref:RDD family protein n=1 Tax=Paenibacillus polymyxa TaxID=1406 RepID=UPI0020184F82|nr:RDD family protein [Paenibacillus polymyxa]
MGKLALGIVVVDEFNQKLSFGRASARYWSKIVSSIILWIGFIMAGFTARKQALHDLIARTYVVDKRELNYILREQAGRGAGM